MKRKTIRRATQAERIDLACRLIQHLVQGTAVFEHAPKAAFVLQAATHLMQAPPTIRETVWRKLCADSLNLAALAAGDRIELEEVSR